MPWSDNSGKNGGNGNDNGGDGPTQGPWGRSPRGGPGRRGSSGGEAPDLEELLNASRQRLKRAFPNGGGRGSRGRDGGGGGSFDPRMIGLGAIVVLVLWIFSGVYQVGPNQLGVETTFGKFSGVTSPGLHWHFPAPIQNAQNVAVTDIRVQAIPAGTPQRGQQSPGLMLTGDKNIVDVEMKVQWRIKPDLIGQGAEKPGVAQYLFNIDDPERLVLTVAEAAIREVVGRNTLNYVQTDGRSVVQEDTKTLMQATLDLQKAGIEITEVNLEKTDPPTEEVNEAFLDVEAAGQDKEQFINKAQAYANGIVPQARGKAKQIVENALGYQAEVTANARGQADRFNAIYTEYKKAPEVTRQRMYLETVEKVLGDMDKVIIEPEAGGGVVPYLPLNELSKKAAQ